MTLPLPLTRASLRDHNSFRFAAEASWLLRVTHPDQFADAVSMARHQARSQNADIAVLGGGSNVLLAEHIDDPILQIATRGVRIRALSGNDWLVHAEAGEPWHHLVEHCATAGLWGIENLSLIPGTVGAAPIQNIGAYGSEIAHSVHQVAAINLQDARSHVFTAAECAFGYRESRFKREAGQWLIQSVTLRLSGEGRPRTDYPGVEAALSDAGIDAPEMASPKDVADAIAAIRRRKLPDPAQVGNAGSFFKNPHITDEAALKLVQTNPHIPLFTGPQPGWRKLSAAWLIEACGWKGHRHGEVGVSAQHALVLVNHGAGSASDILSLAALIADSVRARFGVVLEREPVLLGCADRT
ncbi:MAG: UDP-N-acetylmuramate dehydrogenase [Xanthomonadales bacterium]|jgi:UDP-N-acetylmuramate dehydrogenase|nr:UDP-N-acetylmuramate dehydrogenase [Xanthomonadales bacterium]